AVALPPRRQRVGAGGSQQKERQPQPEALARARSSAKGGQNEAVAGRDLATRGEKLAEPSFVFLVELCSPPPHVLLKHLEPAELGEPMGEALCAVVPGLT